MAGGDRDGKPAPPWEYKFSGDGSVSCLMCGGRHRPTVTLAGVRPDGAPVELGICEACAVYLYWVWKDVQPDAEPSAPDETQADPERVKVVLSRLKRLPSGESANPEAPESYELAMVFRPDGGLDFPSADLCPKESCAEAVSRALGKHGVSTWAPFCEPLYAALSPRGRLARVVLVTAYTTWQRDGRGGVQSVSSEDGGLQWRSWPPWKQAPDLVGLYLAFLDVWPLRIWKHVAHQPRTEGITTCVRRAAAEYIILQQDLRDGKKDVDTSVAELLRRSMSDDEKLVDRLLGEQERRLSERREQEEAEKLSDVSEISDASPAGEEELPDESSGEPGPAGSDDPFAGEPEA